MYNSKALPSGNTTLTDSARKVLVNTYILLSGTLMFSAFMTWMSLNATWFATGVGAIVTLVVAIVLMFAAMGFRNSWIGIVFTFAFTGLMGASLGPMVNHYLGTNGEAVALATVMTGGIFVFLSGYTIVTKKDFGGMGNYLFMALILLIIAMVANIFIQAPMMSLVISYIAAFIFSLFILYDTSEIIHGRETSYISATINLYLDILNLFVHLLSILGNSDD